MAIDTFAQQQRIDRQKAQIRRAQREQSTTKTGICTALGPDTVMVSLDNGSAITVYNLGGVIRVGNLVLVESDSINYYTRGDQSL